MSRNTPQLIYTTVKNLFFIDEKGLNDFYTHWPSYTFPTICKKLRLPNITYLHFINKNIRTFCSQLHFGYICL